VEKLLKKILEGQNLEGDIEDIIVMLEDNIDDIKATAKRVSNLLRDVEVDEARKEVKNLEARIKARLSRADEKMIKLVVKRR